MCIYEVLFFIPVRNEEQYFFTLFSLKKNPKKTE